MLSCKNLTVETADGKKILNAANARFAPKRMHAVIGPSGCGKTTLMKAMLGMIPRTGTAALGAMPIRSSNDLAGRIGFVPQFTLAQPNLTVRETFRYSLALNLSNPAEREQRLRSVLETTKLAPHADKRVGSLSGGQTRRVGLGLELTLSPEYLICDEVTSGLDPNSEDEMLDLLRELVERENKSIICIIHNLAKLSRFDTVSVVLQGNVIFQGSYQELLDYFSVSNALELYTRLESYTPNFWRDKWTVQERLGLEILDEPAPETDSRTFVKQNRAGFFSQLFTLLARRLRLFVRDSGYFALTLAITFGFPCIVVIFALDGLPQVPRMPLEQTVMTAQQVMEARTVQIEQMRIATLATGLVLFQVMLLALMGANNGGREIAAERNLYEKERMTGLRPEAYALSKIIFTAAIAVFQGVWMCAFVKVICNFPGDWLVQVPTMAGVCVAMTLICLGFSALMQSAEKASLLSIYLVGFQLPLSGIVLELPDALVWVFRPFINIYWGWSGFFSAMQSSPIYDAYTLMNSRAAIYGFSVSGSVLLLHAALGAAMVFRGCAVKRPL